MAIHFGFSGMDQNLLSEMRSRLGRYLNGKSSLQQFREWFDVETWGLAGEADSPARQLGGQIELCIAEFTSGHRTEEDLRAHLQSLLRETVSKR